MRELSKAEKFVLTKLEEDSRQPLSRIAKEGRLSSEGVAKIIKRLESNKIILGYKTKSNYSKLGITIYRFLIKLKKKDTLVIARIRKILSKHYSCPWYSFCEGEFDLRISTEISSIQDIADMEHLFIEIDEYLSEKQIMVFLNAFSFGKIFNSQDNRKQFVVIDYQDSAINLTALEKRLIGLLRKNPLIKVTDAASNLGVSIKTVTGTIKKLLKLGVIEGFKSKINMANLNYLPYVALFSLGKYQKSDIEKFKIYCKNKKEITYFIYGAGNYNLELVLFTKSANQFYNLLDEIRDSFKFIKKISVLTERY